MAYKASWGPARHEPAPPEQQHSSDMHVWVQLRLLCGSVQTLLKTSHAADTCMLHANAAALRSHNLTHLHLVTHQKPWKSDFDAPRVQRAMRCSACSAP